MKKNTRINDRAIACLALALLANSAFAAGNGYAACVIRAKKTYNDCVSSGQHSQQFCDRQYDGDMARCKGE
jgi:hypothetical protein